MAAPINHTGVYTPEQRRLIVDDFCRYIADRGINGSMRAFCREPGMPDRLSVDTWIRADPELSEMVSSAQRAQAEAIVDQGWAIVSNKLDSPASRKVQADFLVLQIAALHPAKYAKRQALTDGEGKPLAGAVVQVYLPDKDA